MGRLSHELGAAWLEQLHQKRATPSYGGAYAVKKLLREVLILIRIMFTIEWVLKCWNGDGLECHIKIIIWFKLAYQMGGLKSFQMSPEVWLFLA